MKILIKFPTRGRMNKFFNVIKRYNDYSTSGNIHFLISLDSDDEQMNNDVVVDVLKTYGDKLTYVYGESKSKVDAVNRDIEKIADWDILLLASDDMIPLAKGYDDIIIDKMKEYYPDKDGVLFFSDGHQKEKLNTLSIMGRKYYERFNYIYYPEYKSVWVDNEFTDVANLLGKQTFFDEVIIRHEHPDNGFGLRDQIHVQNVVNEQHDRDLYFKRKNMRFGL